jgi:hypothetical protein
MQWKHVNSPFPRSTKSFFARKDYGQRFWDSKGIINVDFFTGQVTINTQYYSTLLTEKVKQTIRSIGRKPQDSLFFL